MTPLALGIAIGAVLFGALLGPKLGRHVLHGGLVVLGFGLSAWWTVGHFGMELSGWDLAPGTLVAVLAPG